DADGKIFVAPGDHIPAVPDYRFKAGTEYMVTDQWKLGAATNMIGSKYLVGDQANQNPKVPAYWVVNLHSSYRIAKNFEIFGLVRNLFNRHYYVYGTFFQTDSFPYLNLTDPRTFIPGMPSAVYGGIRARFLVQLDDGSLSEAKDLCRPKGASWVSRSRTRPTGQPARRRRASHAWAQHRHNRAHRASSTARRT